MRERDRDREKETVGIFRRSAYAVIFSAAASARVVTTGARFGKTLAAKTSATSSSFRRETGRFLSLTKFFSCCIFQSLISSIDTGDSSSVFSKYQRKNDENNT